MNSYTEYFQANQDLWNQRTAIHKDSAFYDVPGFLAGREMLTPIELGELGDVQGKTLLHLQCHFGLDTLSWARHGAEVTGIDFSESAIAEAKRLSEVAKLPADFICCNVYETSQYLREKKFDIVFTSYGTIGWLPDLEKWAAVIKRHLKEGGIFYIAEFHPVVWMFDDEFSRITYSYQKSDVIVTESNSTYTDGPATITGKEFGWNHSLSEVINALLMQGLQLVHLNEFNYSPYPCFKNMIESEKGKWQIKGLENKIPMMFSIKASATHIER